jgi:ABC-type nickel/cobalt efflux system permease component RcnA
MVNMKSKLQKLLENIGYLLVIGFGFFILYNGLRMIFFLLQKLFTH